MRCCAKCGEDVPIRGSVSTRIKQHRVTWTELDLGTFTLQGTYENQLPSKYWALSHPQAPMDLNYKAYQRYFQNLCQP